ncbi:hypothetical protein J7I98_07940 [Streptomyces sp. ISL-98]|uniref:hypothetical protein n=1 Tax=Streptomyces sp. ISL-98 TaxID=2819192 RepID=UPI001BE4E6C5|nr:hypothetical protein [Streptomyces sp. ISL-98]MBT2505835.1 hypothetical protein [Streptomyces sp. ISL-98]
MKMRGLVTKGALVAAMSGLLLISGGPAQASSGWDYKGATDFYGVGGGKYHTADVYSTGGDIKVCINTAATKNYAYDLFEHDSTNNDEYVTSVTGGGCWTIRDIGKYVDGDNGKAEFYIFTYDPSAMSAQWWD